MAQSRINIPAGKVEDFLANALTALDVPTDDSRTVASLMVEADLLGYDTHGSFRLRQYVNRLRDGGNNPVANVHIAEDRLSTAIVDGDNGLGHLAMRFAADLAVEKARESGIGWIGVRNGNHAGPASLYVNMIAQQDMIGIVGAVGSANHVAPFGGLELLLGTNPLAIAVPAGSEPAFVLDMATTNAAAGKIKVLAQRGESMPEGWMVDQEGKPLTDPTRQSEGLLLPIGGPKGYGLAMAIGLIAGTLNGAAFGRDVVNFTKQTATATNTGQFVAALSVEAFTDIETFKNAVDAIFVSFRNSKSFPDGEPVRIPGQERGNIRSEREENGIPMHPNLVQALDEIATELSLPGLSQD